MQRVEELKLPHLSIQDPAFAIDPMVYLNQARRQHPWLAMTDVGYYLVHEYQAIRDLSYMDDKFRPSMDGITEYMGGQGGTWAEFFANTMLARHSVQDHARLRASVAAWFTPRSINRYRPLMQEVVSRQLAEWAPRGAFDFAEFAANFPIRVMFALIGASLDALPGILKALEAQGMSANLVRSMLPELNQAIEDLWNFVHELIIERRRDGTGQRNDLLDSVLAASAAGQLDEAELHNLLIFLFAAGYDTSKNMLTLIMRMMLDHPEHWIRCAQDRPFCDKVVEETFRYNSVSQLYRTATEDVTYRDVLFPKGTILFMTISLAGRDPGAWVDADHFQPERPDAGRHVAFGRGIHLCLGQYLARAQLQEGIHLIARRLHKPRLVGDVTWRPFPGVWGIRSLPIAFDPAASPEAAH